MAGALPSLGVTIVVFAALWVLSVRRQDCGVVDLYWSWGFAVIAWMALAESPDPSAQQWLFGALVTLWAARLGIYLWLRHRRSAGEDARYRAMRERNGPGWERRSFWMVFMLQAVVLWTVAAPIHVALGPDPDLAPAWLLAVSLLLFGSGLALQTVADAALLRFRLDPGNRGRLLTTGVFAWCRHPNYFGETLVWWGLGLFALGLSGSVLALLGPALLTVLLLKVSGVPLLEDHLKSRPGYADYARRTRAFLPLPPGARQARRP